MSLFVANKHVQHWPRPLAPAEKYSFFGITQGEPTKP